MTGIIAADVGQTAFRLQVDGGDIVESSRGVTALTSDENVFSLAQQVAAHVPAGVRTSSIGIGLSGFVAGSEAPLRLAEHVQRLLGADSVTVAADAVTAFLGTIGPRSGTVAICGTGVAALGIDIGAAPRRIDARGFLLGDFGSGFWIGQRGLQSALDALEGRGESTLLSTLSERLGSPADIYHRAMGSTPPPKFVATFAPDVIRAATDGDAVAVGIVKDAATEVARTIRAARISDGPVGLTGGLARATIFVTGVREALSRLGVAADDFLVRPDGSLDGAHILAGDRTIRPAFAGLIAVKE